MSLVSEIPSIVIAFISLIDHAYIYLISAFWYISTEYGLRPQYAFIQAEFGNLKFSSLFSVFTGFYAQIVAIGLLASSLIFLFENSFMESTGARNYLVRIAVAMSLVVFSFDIMKAVLYMSDSLFTIIWNGSGINWFSLSSVVNTNYSFLGTLNLSAGENELVEFFLLSSLFVSIGTLFGILMIREALLLVLVIALPFLSVLLLVPRFDSYTMRFWSLFIQLSVLPFFIIIPLYLASLFPGNFPLQLSLITGASLMPLLFVTSTRIFSIGSLYSLLDSLNFQRSLNRLPVPQLDDLASFSFSRNNTGGLPGTELSGNGTVDWSKVYSKDFDYSRFGGK